MEQSCAGRRIDLKLASAPATVPGPHQTTVDETPSLVDGTPTLVDGTPLSDQDKHMTTGRINQVFFRYESLCHGPWDTSLVSVVRALSLHPCPTMNHPVPLLTHCQRRSGTWPLLRTFWPKRER